MSRCLDVPVSRCPGVPVSRCPGVPVRVLGPSVSVATIRLPSPGCGVVALGDERTSGYTPQHGTERLIPPFEGEGWYLPAGLHSATLDEIEVRFVQEAPFERRRRDIYAAFRLWHGMVSTILPGARFWVDGGFVTHKSWAAPSDVDVTVLVKPDDLDGLSEEHQQRLESLLTKPGPSRVQPMSGMVDSFICARGDVDRTLYWREHWSSVVGEERALIPGAEKGFLEVKP